MSMTIIALLRIVCCSVAIDAPRMRQDRIHLLPGDQALGLRCGCRGLFRAAVGRNPPGETKGNCQCKRKADPQDTPHDNLLTPSPECVRKKENSPGVWSKTNQGQYRDFHFGFPADR